MDYDEMQSDGGGGQSPEPHQDDFLDDVADEIDNWERERSQTPVYDTDKVGKPRKRLIKKVAGDGGKESGTASFVEPELVDDYEEEEEEEEDYGGFDREGSGDEGKKRKKFGMEKGKKKFSSKGEKKFGGKSGSGSKSGLMKKGMMYSGKLVSGKDDGEVKEMWDTIAGGDSEVFI